jgi:carbon-monoxide dehydrogenase medium subunit
MDLPPLLTALGAGVTVAGARGERQVALEDLFVGYYETALGRDELITDVRIPFHDSHKAAYLKVTTGSADDWPALGIAVVLDTEAGAIARARIVIGGATTKVTRLTAAEDVLRGKAIAGPVLAEAGEAAVEGCEILADVRGSVPYKRELIRVYLARAVRAALNGAGEQ